MKKTSLIIILLIFAVPMALYHFIKMPSGSDFSSAIATQGKAKVLEFFSPMCYDCKRIEGEVDPLITEYSDSIVFQKINVAARTPEIDKMITKYEVDVVPTLIYLDKNGTMQAKTQGYLPKAQIKEHLDKIK